MHVNMSGKKHAWPRAPLSMKGARRQGWVTSLQVETSHLLGLAFMALDQGLLAWIRGQVV